MSQPTWELAPDWQRESAISGVEAHLKEVLPPSASHEAWLSEKQATGWKYGPVKDADAKEHPCMVPFDELPLNQQLKDYLFAAVVGAFRAAQPDLAG